MAKNVLTTGQKIQIGVIVLGLAVSSFLVFSTIKPDGAEPAYRAVAATQRHFPADAKRPFSPERNPYDPKKDQMVHTFLASDGGLTLVEYPNDPTRAMGVEFHPDRRDPKNVFQYCVDPVSLADKLKDPFSRAMAYAVYLKVYSSIRRPSTISFLATLRPPMTDDQRQQEQVARQSADTALQSIDEHIAVGAFEPELVKQITAALHDFENDTKHAIGDKSKQEQQEKIWQLAAAYMNKQYEAKNRAVDKYIVAMKEILAPNQRENLIAEIEQRQARATNPALPVRRTATRGVVRTTRPATRSVGTAPANSAATAPQ